MKNSDHAAGPWPQIDFAPARQDSSSPEREPGSLSHCCPARLCCQGARRSARMSMSPASSRPIRRRPQRRAGASDPRTPHWAPMSTRASSRRMAANSPTPGRNVWWRALSAPLTLVSENPQQSTASPCSTRLPSTPLPCRGGFLYVTRGLLALANDASEVAAVLSHEMAHVTANHGLERQRREKGSRTCRPGGAGTVLQFHRRSTGRCPAASCRSPPSPAIRNSSADVIGVRMLGEAGLAIP